MSDKAVKVFVGTRKGAFIFTSDEARRSWKVSEPLFKGWNVMHMMLDPRDQRLHAAVVHDVFGPSLHYSDDLGETWIQAKETPSLERPSLSGRPLGSPDEFAREAEAKATPEKVVKIWNITPGRPGEPGVLYAGVQPATLFKSTDRGESWTLNEHLYDHPHRGQWNPGAGGLCLHTIILDPTDENRMYVGISAAGCYRTDDGGVTWRPMNKNVRADFSPNIYPEFGQCLHKMDMHPSRPNVLFQQNHCGMYRSDNAGEDWIDIGEGKLPTRFGFPIAIHPHDPKTVYLIPEADETRTSPGGKFVIWRTQDDGETWQQLTEGLPQKAHLLVLREAMATDSCAEAGIYAGTTTGQVFNSNNSGDSWDLLADFLPTILTVETAVV